ncbi:hypothetical protein EJ03DRAFT_48203 [Teratosphaeria nubilosa]|uniref:Uncharacterized protein n=1 Tax=Teratosphaeria nubilosa TaxID=161662 RepID=A0A6G1KU71_9PEZI|nr:hypothetical protein EJ03DRAFT_48203 [Teratosphaeria nubilosa]
MNLAPISLRLALFRLSAPEARALVLGYMDTTDRQPSEELAAAEGRGFPIAQRRHREMMSRTQAPHQSRYASSICSSMLVIRGPSTWITTVIMWLPHRRVQE